MTPEELEAAPPRPPAAGDAARDGDGAGGGTAARVGTAGSGATTGERLGSGPAVSRASGPATAVRAPVTAQTGAP
ncbi:hypothetical protein ACFXP3_35865, partial [Streptomyces sp. NPDC059096]